MSKIKIEIDLLNFKDLTKSQKETEITEYFNENKDFMDYDIKEIIKDLENNNIKFINPTGGDIIKIELDELEYGEKFINIPINKKDII